VRSSRWRRPFTVPAPHAGWWPAGWARRTTGAVADALDETLLELRQRTRDLQAEYWREGGLDDDPVPDSFLDQVWPAAVAYAICLQTQAEERPCHRPPLQHLPGSFDELREHLTLIDSVLDFDDIESTVGVGIEAVTEALWPQP
jgi:hypothetical protein